MAMNPERVMLRESAQKPFGPLPGSLEAKPIHLTGADLLNSNVKSNIDQKAQLKPVPAAKQNVPKKKAPKQKTPKQKAPQQEAPKQKAPQQGAPKQKAPTQKAKQKAPKQKPPKQKPTQQKKKASIPQKRPCNDAVVIEKAKRSRGNGTLQSWRVPPQLPPGELTGSDGVKEREKELRRKTADRLSFTNSTAAKPTHRVSDGFASQLALAVGVGAPWNKKVTSVSSFGLPNHHRGRSDGHRRLA